MGGPAVGTRWLAPIFNNRRCGKNTVVNVRERGVKKKILIPVQIVGKTLFANSSSGMDEWGSGWKNGRPIRSHFKHENADKSKTRVRNVIVSVAFAKVTVTGHAVIFFQGGYTRLIFYSGAKTMRDNAVNDRARSYTRPVCI